jgi:hypothetical protein
MDWFKRQLSDRWPELLWGVIVMGGGTWAAIWAGILDWGPAIIFGVIGLLVFLLVGINQINIIKQRRSRLSIKRNEEIETIFQKWLLKQGYSLKDDKQEGTLFQFVATNLQNLKVIITRRKEIEWGLQIWAVLNVGEEDRKKFALLAKKTRVGLLLEAKIEMARLGVEWDGLKDPLDTVKLFNHIPLDDALTEWVFLQQIWFILRAEILLQEVINKMIHQAEIPSQSTSGTQGSETV